MAIQGKDKVAEPYGPILVMCSPSDKLYGTIDLANPIA